MSNDHARVCPICRRSDMSTRERIDWKYGRKVDQYSCAGCWKDFLDLIDAMRAMNGPGA